jgi:ATP-binding cassette subfamily C protein LapB
VLSPVAAVAAQALQWSYAKAALEGLDALWRLENDHHDHEPVVLDNVHGNYQFDKVTARYGASPALVIPQLSIQAGERIGIIGPVGAGKTTLLRLLSGMYKPQEGRILLDGVDLSHIAKAPLSERIGYLQQEGRLFAGTLRENLLLGLADPGDPAILAAAQRTGLMQAVITPHPRGLQQEIFEGGTGLSGGQRQLVNLTRVVLREPVIWLLDEPTSSVDGNSELQIKQLIHQTLQPQHTLVLVTHKPDMLQLVDRILVVANHQVVMDGPKAQVLARLNANTNANTGTNNPTNGASA